jgi:hypothetical protein
VLAQRLRDFRPFCFLVANNVRYDNSIVVNLKVLRAVRSISNRSPHESSTMSFQLHHAHFNTRGNNDVC